MNTDNNEKDSKLISRRNLIISAGLASAALAAEGVLGNIRVAHSSPGTVAQSVYGYGTLNGVSTIVPVSIDELRNNTAPDSDARYYITDIEKHGFFYYDSNDTTTPDNTGTVVVSTSGARFKRIVEGIYNVVWFGAKEDAAFDSKPPIQAAIDAAVADGGGTVFFPPNRFRIAQNINVSGSLQLVGAPGSIIDYDHNTGHCIEVSADNVLIKGLTFETEYAFQCGQVAILSKNVTVTECRFNGRGWAGVLMKDTAGSTVIDRNFFKDYAFMVCGHGSRNNIITNNHFTGGSTEGVPNQNGWATEPVGDGVKLSSSTGSYDPQYFGPQDNVIANNIFDNCYRDAVDMFTDGSYTIVTGNVIRNLVTTGLDIKTIYRDSPYEGGTSIPNVRQISRIVVSGNLFQNIGIKPDSNFININHQEYRSGVTRDPANGPKLISIIGNYFETCSGNGIDIIASIGVMIHNNILRDVTKRGISVTGNCSDITIQGNDVESKEHGITSTSAGNKHVMILDNRITAGIANSNFSALLVVGERNQISGNHIKAFANGVFVSGATKTLVQGNHINNCSSAGIRFESTVATSSIMNNQMSDCPTAIRFDSTCSKISAFNNVGIDSPNGFVNTNLVTGYTEANNTLVTS